MESVRGLGLEVFEPAPVGVAVTAGPEHRVIYTNAAHRSMFGRRRMGAPVSVTFADIAEYGDPALFDKVVKTGEVCHVPEAAVTLFGAGGLPEERFFTFSLSRIPLGRGEWGVLSMGVEITEQVTATQRVEMLSEERLRVLRRYQNLVRVGAEIVWVSRPDGQVTEMSAGWERATGQTVEDVRKHNWVPVMHPDDAGLTLRSWLLAVERVDPIWEHTFRVRIRDGSYRHFHARAVPVRERDQVIEWVGTCMDVEDQWQEDRRKELLDRAAATTAGVPDLSKVLGALARVVVPELADGCIVHLLLDYWERPSSAAVLADRVVTVLRDGLPEAPSSTVRERYLPDSVLGRTVRESRAVRAGFAPGQQPRGIANRALREWMTEIKVTSVVMLPVVVEGSVAAGVAVFNCGDRPPVSLSDVALVGQMLDHARGPLSNAMRFQRAQRMALALQRSLLAEPPAVKGLEIAARYRASPAAAEVGGDWYDSFELPDGAVVLTIGDVAGHDLPAAVTMSQLRNMLRGLAVDRQEPPGDILRRLDVAMDTLRTAGTASCVLARVEQGADGWRLNYASAGHPPPLLVTADGEGRFLEDAQSPLLGIVSERSRISAVEPLPPGATLLLYTDGLVEHPGEHLDDSLDRLRDYAVTFAHEPLDTFCEELLTGMPVTGKDDIAAMALRLPADSAVSSR